MLNAKNKLTVLHDDNGAFADYSKEALDFARDQISITVSSTQDYIYVGYYKPINALYIEVSTANSNAATLSGEYYNGASYTALDSFLDESKAFARSGFLHWSKNQTDITASTVNSTELFWYRFRPSADTSAIVIDGLNIVFADDIDLKKELYEISEFLPTGANSHILTHEIVRDEIVQEIRRSGAYKESLSTGRLKEISAFDFLDIEQVRQAAIYMALSKIYLNVSDDGDGIFRQKSIDYNSKYKEQMRLFYLDLDRDDDGNSDEEEELASATFRMIRR